jgi:hypothetical protein
MHYDVCQEHRWYVPFFFESSADTSLDPVILYVPNRALLYFRFLTPLDATKFHDVPVVMYKGRQTRDIT